MISNLSIANNFSSCGFYIADALKVNYHIFDIYYDLEEANEEDLDYDDLIGQLLDLNQDFREKCSHFKMKIRSKKLLDVQFNFK